MIVSETTVALPVMAYLLAVLVNISVYQIVLPPGGSRHDLNFVPLTRIYRIWVRFHKKADVCHRLPIIAVADNYTSLLPAGEFFEISASDVFQLPPHCAAQPGQLPQNITGLFLHFVLLTA